MKIVIPAIICDTFTRRVVATALSYSSLSKQFGLLSAEDTKASIQHSEIPFFANIEEYSNSFVSVSKEQDNLVIAFNNDAVVDAINCGFNLYDKIGHPLTKAASLVKEWSTSEVGQFSAKWAPVKVDENGSEPTEEEENGLSLISTSHGVSLYQDMQEEAVSQYVRIKDKLIGYRTTTCIRESEPDSKYVISTYLMSLLIESEDSADNLAKQQNLPVNVVEAIQAIYPNIKQD